MHSPFDEEALTAVRSLGDLVAEEGRKVEFLFSNCTGLTAVPEGLFANRPGVTSFEGCFYDCTGLTAIPAGLFANCPAVTSFKDCFGVCTGLTAVPEGLFANCPGVTSFEGCFYGCTGLTGETPYTMVDGKKIKLWERSPENGFTKVTSRVDCFGVCTGLSDYAEIPAGWK